MDKKKLFLDTTDIAQMTGLSIRSARNMMRFIKDERRLGKQQSISIYDFCYCFHFPVHVVFVYINTDLFNNGPIDEDGVRRDYQKKVLESGDMSFLYHKDMDLFMTGKDLKVIESRDQSDKNDDLLSDIA